MRPPLFLLLCEYASVGKDQTCTIVRGGIERWSSELPLVASLSLYCQIDAGALLKGKHNATMEVVSPQGLVLFSAGLLVDILNPDFPARFVVPFVVSVQSYGKCVVRVQVESLPTAETNLIVEEGSSK